jgi:AbrB family looped-hinge helix DNA binding protein
MREIVSTVTSEGQVIIPVEVREHLGMKGKSKVRFVIEEGEVKLRAAEYPDVAALSGAAGRLETPLSWEEMREIAREERVASKYR